MYSKNLSLARKLGIYIDYPKNGIPRVVERKCHVVTKTNIIKFMVAKTILKSFIHKNRIY